MPIIERSNRNHVITFDSHLKTALLLWFWVKLVYSLALKVIKIIMKGCVE